ncbi:MAG TPA: hypothetical protein DCE41_29550 [Cytophagales bacterium]|nr:hypothetical protein [Cytophagales bacterium]HAA21492.1 hypothetical protein [Cytophagales bacterium]HAP64625.1 hypothetical protein [Cytophagales bacterium]
MTYQTQLSLPPFSRGFHLITSHIQQAIRDWPMEEPGLLQVFIQHTSASLTINENADPTVRMDFESHFNQSVPENAPYYRHTLEGSDDMPAHIKASTLGSSVTVPVNQGQLLLGTWQGIYLCEHRNHGGHRSVIITYLH